MTRVIVTFQNDPVVIPIRVELDKLQAVPPPDKLMLHKCLLVSFFYWIEILSPWYSQLDGMGNFSMQKELNGTF